MFEMRSFAHRLLRNGYAPLPVNLGSKAVKMPGWHTVEVTPELIDRWFNRPQNIAVRLGDMQVDGTCLIAIDVDIDEHQLIRCVERAIGQLAPAKRGKKGATFILRCREALPTQRLHWLRDGTKRPAVDVLGVGSQTVLPPSTHPTTHQPYFWIAGTPLDQIRYEELPVCTPAAIDEIRGFCKDPEDKIYRLNDMLWLGVGGGGDTHDTCLAAVASMVSRGWVDEDIHARVGRAKREAAEHAGQAYDWPAEEKTIQGWADSARAKYGAGTRTSGAKPVHGVLADQFLEHHASLIRYDREGREWYYYDGVQWQANQEFQVRNLIGQKFLPDHLRTKATIDGVLSSLKDRPALSMKQDDWDPDRHLLNTPAGTVDLRTGHMREHRPDDLITRCTSVSPDPSGDCSLWEEKLGEWFPDSPEEVAYHQQLAGYFITGETRDPCFAMWHGPGSDGKSTIVKIYKFIMGPYAQTTTETAFLETRNGQHSEEIACLRKARLVFISEAGGKWNENRIKAVTGGDQLTASFKFKSVFSYYPEFKPLVTTNEWPWISSTGRAMERRLHVYPFTPVIGELDRHLDQKLQRIAGAILSWMIEGAVRYYQEGLSRSPVVEAANLEYLHEHDILQQFLEEYIEFDPEFKTRTTAIYAGFRQFCEQHGLKPYSLATLTKRLRAKGIECRTAQLARGEDPKRAYMGIRIRVEIDIDERY